MLRRDVESWTRRLLGATLAVGLALGVSACDEGATGPGGGSTSLSVQLTDAPGDVHAVWVEITDVQLVGGPADTTNGDGNGPGGNGAGGPMSLLDESTDLVKLSDLVNTTQTIVNDAQVPAGTYTGVRVLVGDAVLQVEGEGGEGGDAYVAGDPVLPEGVTESDVVGDLQCPSCPQTGIKVKLPGGNLQLEGTDNDLILDFDVAQSFGHRAGMSGMWVMHPVIIATEATGAGSIAGTVELASDSAGTVSIPECGGSARTVQGFVPTATATTDGETTKTAQVAEDGSYVLSAVSPGDWSMDYEPEVVFDGDTLVFEADVNGEEAPVDVTVESGAETTVDYTIISATCNAGGGS